MSLSATVLKVLRRSFALGKPRYHTQYHDLDPLAGTWTKQDRAEFEKHTRAFSRIDEDMWIAASALQHGAAVCSLDSHFGQIDGLIACTPS